MMFENASLLSFWGATPGQAGPRLAVPNTVAGSALQRQRFELEFCFLLSPRSAT